MKFASTDSKIITLKRAWADPLAVAASVPKAEDCWVLLYSGMRLDFTGRYSILALKKDKEIKSAGFAPLEKALSDNHPTFQNAWFGYLGYGLKNQLEDFPKDAKNSIPMPDLWMVRFKLIAVFDHQRKSITLYAKTKKDAEIFDTLAKKKPKTIPAPGVSKLASNISRKKYLYYISAIKEAILSGDLYQANLTRKFFGSFRKTPDAFSLFLTLCKTSPAPYSAFIKLKDTFILSSSPESFLSITKEGKVETRPIKGSLGKNKTARQLKASEKDRAENLMIVDLMRNDLARTSEPGSIKVKSLFDITSYATVHHMSSTVVSKKREDKTTLDVVKACFPPGSMTGAPKIEAVKLCSQLEKVQRGVYSGAIGWFGGDGSAALSVVIRTILLRGKNFEFQVGGGIVADSLPQGEWKETLVKAKALIKTLGIAPETLRKL